MNSSVKAATYAPGVWPAIRAGRQNGQSLLSLFAAALFCGSTLVAHGQAFISDFSPKAGMPGDTIQVYGSGFSVGSIHIYFWNGKQAVTTVTSDTMLRAVVPAGAVTGVLGVQRDSATPIYTSTPFTIIGAGPYITDVSPNYGDTNTLVVISGVHLAGVKTNGVRFNGVSSVDAYSSSADGTQITAHVPYGTPPGSAPVQVTTSSGTSNSPTAFTVVGPGPYVIGFDPDHGTTNLPISIVGMHFLGTTNVLFDGIPGTGLNVSDTSITVRTPSGVRTGPLTVNSPRGSFTTTSNFFVPPTLTAFSPGSGRAGTNVILTGANLRGATNATFNGLSGALTVSNNTTALVVVPVGASSGIIQVLTPDFSCTNSTRFVVLPTIYGSNPNFGAPGTNVLISGANFNVGTPSIWFNGVKAQTVTSVSFGQLKAVVPAAATTGPISIQTADGNYTNVNPFYLPANITGLSPRSGPPGTPITISGVNFLGASSVNFAGIPSPFTVSDNSSITAFVPNNVASGRITVTTPAGTATSSTAFYASPQIFSFSPSNGLPGTNVTIVGTNFLDATAIRFNGVSANFSYINNGRIVAVVPAGALAGPISVEAPGGTNLTVSSFLLDYQSNLETWMTDAPDPVTATSNLVYSTTVVNRGPFDAPHVRLTNTLPSSVTLVAADMSWPWLLATNANQIVATIDNLAVGAASTLVVTVAPQAPGTVVAGSSVTCDQPDPVPGNNSFALTTTVTPLPLLSIRWWTNQLKLSWHSGLSNFVLESVIGSPGNTAWVGVTNSPVIEGTQKSVILSNTAPLLFYRLKK